MIKDVLKNNGQLSLISGPCVIESEAIVMEIAEKMIEIADLLQLDYYFKASFDKANRTSAKNYRGPGLEQGLALLQKVKDRYGCKIVTDIHEPYQAERVATVADIIQIPAFLFRQTDLLEAAAKTGKIINVKKAQFAAPSDMKNVIGKLEHFGNDNILLCERGTCFGYQRLIVDMPGLAEMRSLGYPVIFDATHSVQLTGAGMNNSNSGQSQYVEYLARAATATGIDGLFMEVHPNPLKALSDGSCMLQLDKVESLLRDILKIHEIVQSKNLGEESIYGKEKETS